MDKNRIITQLYVGYTPVICGLHKQWAIIKKKKKHLSHLITGVPTMGSPNKNNNKLASVSPKFVPILTHQPGDKVVSPSYKFV